MSRKRRRCRTITVVGPERRDSPTGRVIHLSPGFGYVSLDPGGRRVSRVHRSNDNSGAASIEQTEEHRRARAVSDVLPTEAHAASAGIIRAKSEASAARLGR